MLDRVGRRAARAGTRRRRRARPTRTTRAAVTASAQRRAQTTRRERRERERAADEAHDRLAARRGCGRAGTRGRPSRAATAAYAGHIPSATCPSSAGEEAPSAPSPTNAGQARRAPSCSSAFQAPGLPSPTSMQVHAVPARDEQRDRDRAEQVAHECRDRTPSVPSPPSTSSATRARAARGLPRMGLDRPLLRARPGLRFFRLLGTGRGEHDDAVGRPAPLGAVRGLGRRRRARRLPGRLGDRGALARRSAREAYTVRLAPVRAHGAWGGRDPLGGARRAAARTGRSRSSPARRSGRARRSPSTARCRRPARALRGRPGLLASVAIGELPVAAPGDVLALARPRRRAGVRLPAARPPRGRPAHARGGLVLRGAVRALRALRRRGDVGRARPAAPPARSRATLRPPSVTSGRPPPGCTVPPVSHRPSTPRIRLPGRRIAPRRPCGAPP